jgi:GT2 family glycosyltransferase
MVRVARKRRMLRSARAGAAHALTPRRSASPGAASLTCPCSAVDVAFDRMEKAAITPTPRPKTADTITIVVVTHNRLPLLRECVNNVLLRTSGNTKIVVWNNASSDGTREYLESLSDERIRIVHYHENIGQSAYRLAFEQADGHYLIELDDDVIDAPPDWDVRLLRAFCSVPDLGFLAADVMPNEHDHVSTLRHVVRPHLYVPSTVNETRLLEGPVGGWCAMTSREVYERVGGFRTREDRIYWYEDAAYVADVERLGYRTATLADLRVAHGAREYVRPSDEKLDLSAALLRRAVRRNRLKRLLLSVPLVARLNARFGWFQRPDDRWVEHYRRMLAAAGR